MAVITALGGVWGLASGPLEGRGLADPRGPPLGRSQGPLVTSSRTVFPAPPPDPAETAETAGAQGALGSAGVVLSRCANTRPRVLWTI